MNTAAVEHIDEDRLETDLAYRFSYLTDFMGFSEEDVKVILGSAEFLAGKVEGLVDAVYVKLFHYDCTKRHFLPRQSGYEGPVPGSMEELTLDHEQIKFRKSHLTNYLVRLVSGPYDERMIQYLNRVGAIHTPAAGAKELDVPLVQMNALLGFVADAVNATILGSDLDAEMKQKAVRAFSKLLWLQSDLITRHYAIRN